VAILAFVAQLTFVNIVDFMAGNTLPGYVFKALVGVAAFTGYLFMFAGELESGFIVIKTGFFPGRGLMAFTALVT
jgi:hypothetical protein